MLEAILNDCYVARRYVQFIGENVQDIKRLALHFPSKY